MLSVTCFCLITLTKSLCLGYHLGSGAVVGSFRVVLQYFEAGALPLRFSEKATVNIKTVKTTALLSFQLY